MLNCGEVIQIIPKECLWEGWLWCMDSRGIKGWIPESFVDMGKDSKTGKLNRNYDATELTIEIGEELEIIFKESSWYYCHTQDGIKGWLPADNLEIK